MLGGFLFPFAAFGLGGQLLYRHVFSSYMGRDTLRLGIGLRGTVGAWLAGWATPGAIALALALGVVLALALYALVRGGRRGASGPVPLAPPALFVGALVVIWFDQVDSRFLQAATPDVCFAHGVVHAVRMGATGQWAVRQGVSMRAPAALPPLVSARARRSDVVVILTESVRADALCSDPPPLCRARFLDEVAGDRIALGKLTSQTPNTFSASMILWTGMPPNVDFASAHAAPVIWELARALGYRTGYVTAQNDKYEDFGAFFRRAGIDVLVTATDLGGMKQEQLGAPDERAAAEALRFVRSVPEGTPYLAVLQLSNTHAPYRAEAGLEPYSPHSDRPLGSIGELRNHYRNAVLLQERTLAAFVGELRRSPRWDDTVVVLLSDHGEQFREHAGLYHNHSLYDEELRIPGFVVAGARVLEAGERAAIATFRGRRTYTQDVHATLVDLLGLHDARGALPLGALLSGRSLLRESSGEPPYLLATSTAVWEPDDARFGVMEGERMLVGSPASTWTCFDMTRDPLQRAASPIAACGAMPELAARAFATAGVPPR